MANLTGARSTFPASIDDILELYTLPASQKTNALRYQELIMKTSLTQAESDELAGLIAILQNYIIDVEKWNKFGDILINMQNFFKNETEGYIETKQIEFQAEIDKFTYRGVYTPGTSYYTKNIVEFFDGSTTQLYLATEDSINKTPTDTGYWRVLTVQGPEGPRGADGIGLLFQGEWDENTTYTADDGAQYGGVLFASLVDNNLGNVPNLSGDTEYWARVMHATVTVSRLSGVRTVVNNTSVVNFITGDIISYNPSVDSIEVFMNSVRLTKNLDYTIGAGNETIVKTSGSWIASSVSPAVFEIVVTKNVIDNQAVFADGNYIIDNTIGSEKLKGGVLNEVVYINENPPIEDYPFWFEVITP